MKKIAVAVIISVITLADLCGQEKAIEYEGHVSAYISYPSPGFGDWQNPGCGLMTTHGVRFNRSDLFLGASVGLDLQFPWFPVPAFTVGLQPKYYFVDRPLDLQFPWFPVPAFTVGLQPKYYFVDRPRTEFFLLCEGGYIINGYGSESGYVMPGVGVGFKLKNSHRVDLSIDVRTVFGDFASVGSPASVYPHLAVGYRF